MQKQSMVAALWSNSNWDDDKDNKGHRKRAIEGIEENYREAIEAVELAMSTRPVEEEEKMDDNNPFFAAAERGLQKIETAYSGKPIPKDPDEEINYMKGLDQA